ncbi:MAG TPA: glycerophosphodiester phosphodiesterase, partial [Stenomitos sp.]
LAERAVLISFDHHAIHEAKRLAPEIAGGVLYYAQPVHAPMLAQAAAADALGPSAELVTADEVKSAHAAGLKVFAWTATRPEQGVALSRLGVDAMGANAPGAVLAALSAARSEGKQV